MKFNVTFVINAVELISNVFEIKEEVKTAFLATNYFHDMIRIEMKRSNVDEKIISVFNETKPKEIFDNYVSVNEADIKYDYDGAWLSTNRANCYFIVPCFFDIDKYIESQRRK